MSTMTDTLADSKTARRAMIDSQLRTSGVNEEYVLARMLAVPREGSNSTALGWLELEGSAMKASSSRTARGRRAGGSASDRTRAPGPWPRRRPCSRPRGRGAGSFHYGRSGGPS